MKVDVYRNTLTGTQTYVPTGSPVPERFRREPLQLLEAGREDDTPETEEAFQKQGWRRIKIAITWTEKVIPA